MQTVLTQLSRLSPGPFDCIVHLGAGADADSADYSVLDPKHIVLIEADPESHTALAERFADTPHVTIINALVAQENGDIAFNRFTLPSFNAPFGLGRLRELYPRIDLVEELRIQGQPLHEIVREPVLGARNLLIFDIPGQEAAVLRSLPSDLLARFSSMIVIACAESWQEGTEPLEATLATLKDKQFELVREASEDPAWPVILLQRDEAKVKLQEELDRNARLFVGKATQIHQQTEKIAELEGQLASMATTCREAETEKARALRRLSATEKSTKSAVKKRALAASERKKADHARRKQIETLIAERDELATRLAALESDHSSLSTHHSSLVTDHSSLSTHHSSLVAERDELAARHAAMAETTARLAAGEQELQQLRASAAQHAQERGALVLRLEELERCLEDLASRHRTLVGERAALEAEHSELVPLHSSLIAERDELISARDALATRLAAFESEHSELATRHQQLATALESLQSQHSSLVAERDALVTEREALQSAHSSLSTLHSSLVAERDALVAERDALSAKTTLLDVLTKGRVAQDHQMEKLLQEKKTLISERDALASRVSDLVSQVEKLEAHAKLIDEEFGKAEGQIDLIKDIFLREAIR